MERERPLRIGVTCYPSIGGSGILASTLGADLALRGHEVHFISYERPFRLPHELNRVHFHPVGISSYGLFKYSDYTLPLSVKMAEVSREYSLDILHTHYAVPHATAALLARSMLPAELRPKVVATLHGTDTTLLGRDPGYGPAIRHALECADAVTVVSEFLRDETRRLLHFDRPIDVVHNYFEPKPPVRTREEVRQQLGVSDELIILHSSNLRPIKRIDLLLEAAARVRPRQSFRLVVLAGEDFAPFAGDVHRLGLGGRVVVLERVTDIEDYLQAADLGLFTSDSESFCLSILEAMCFGCPSVATSVGGIPEVVEDGVSGILVPPGDAAALAHAIEALIADPARRATLGEAARRRASERFSAEVIVPRYEALYRRVCNTA
jgi:N-acetyl-alpha-D-glucosaminyl L-malate synthase BshA